MPRRVFITVAEVSGDQHAAQLIACLRQLDPGINIEGLGGPHMRSAGATIHHETTGRAAMSYHALVRAAEVWNLRKWTREYYRESPPDLAICVDSPAMNLHFAKVARERGIPVLYYIPPQLWAWRIQRRRMRKLRRRVDQVACILPFEEDYFRGHGLNATFVGHPLFDALPAGRFARDAERYPRRPPVIGLLTGSRRSEAVANFGPMLEVAQGIRGAFPDVSFLVPTTPSTHPVVQQMARNFPAMTIGLDEFDHMVPNCDLCITKSGTSTLHVAGYGVPMIVVYRGSVLLWHLVARWLIKTRTYSLVNVLARPEAHVVPEFIPWYGSNEPVARCAIDLLKDPGRLEWQRRRLREVIEPLDQPGASMNTAKLALSMM